MTNEIQHPGAHVRARVIPSDMNVTTAAKLLEVSRPALSNLLNGNADLSPEMAARLEAAFGTPARELLDLQSAWDATNAKRASGAPTIKAYVPPFLQIKAARIEDWASSGIASRQRLSVFLRTLVNSTAANLAKVDFPGNDDAELAGTAKSSPIRQPRGFPLDIPVGSLVSTLRSRARRTAISPKA